MREGEFGGAVEFEDIDYGYRSTDQGEKLDLREDMS